MNVLTQYDESENESEYSKTDELTNKITILQTNQKVTKVNKVTVWVITSPDDKDPKQWKIEDIKLL